MQLAAHKETFPRSEMIAFMGIDVKMLALSTHMRLLILTGRRRTSRGSLYGWKRLRDVEPAVSGLNVHMKHFIWVGWIEMRTK